VRIRARPKAGPIRGRLCRYRLRRRAGSSQAACLVLEERGWAACPSREMDSITATSQGSPADTLSGYGQPADRAAVHEAGFIPLSGARWDVMFRQKGRSVSSVGRVSSAESAHRRRVGFRRHSRARVARQEPGCAALAVTRIEVLSEAAGARLLTLAASDLTRISGASRPQLRWLIARRCGKAWG
jgi:hypothetical protein